MKNLDSANVSVIIPCFRCAETIRRAVESIFNQTLRPKEVVLVDDSSGDETLEALYGLQSSYPPGWITVISLPENSGPATARNTGWDLASQPYIAFLDADDAWFPQKVEAQFQWMIEHPNAVFTGHGEVVSSKVVNNNDYLLIPKKVGLTKLLFSNRFVTSSVMMKREVTHRFPEKIRYAEDYSLWLRMVAHGYDAYRFGVPLTILCKDYYGQSGLSSNLWAMEKGELDCFVGLYKSGFVGIVRLGFVCCFSLMKFVRRLLIVRSKNLFDIFRFNN